MAVFHVLGLGPSGEYFVPDGSPTIGVNDIWSRFKTDHVVCIDPPECRAFTSERLRTIRSCQPEVFWTNRPTWSDVQGYRLIKLHPRGPEGLKRLDDESGIPCSIDSTYVACCIAYRLGAQVIKLWGADFTGHATLGDPEKLKRIFDSYAALKGQLNRRGVQLIAGHHSSPISKILF